jgi:hypothetical protein
VVLPLRASRALAAAALLVAGALVLRSALGVADGLDYFADAAFPIDALARGDLRGFAANPALMGDFSLFLRAPFVWLVFDRDVSVVYLAGALPCLAALVALALYLRRRVLARGLPVAAALLVGLLAVLNPGTFRSLHWGHPEEILAGALCVGAIVAATRGRGLPAGVLLGLAVATKQWAVIAVIPTLLAATRHRIRLSLVAGALAGAIALPALLLQPQAVVGTHAAIIQAQPVAGPANVWWPFSTPRTAVERNAGAPGFGRRRERPGPYDTLGLFALLMLLRCLLDPWNNDYYHAPMLLSLLAWEALGRDGWPRLGLFAGAALALTFPASADSMSALSADAPRICVTYLAWALPLAAWLAMALFAPRRLAAWEQALRGRLARSPLPAVAPAGS